MSVQIQLQHEFYDRLMASQYDPPGRRVERQSKQLERLRVDVPEDRKLLSIFTDVFDCFFRFLAANLAAEGILEEDDFWRTVAEVTRDYQRSVPGLADKFRQYDMFAPEFALSCLNRLQLRNNRQMVDLADPSGALQLVGTPSNPIAGR